MRAVPSGHELVTLTHAKEEAMTLNISRYQHSRDPQPSPTVKEVQQWLNRKISARLTEDGIFGPKTQAAVIAFQKKASLGPDGIVGPKTWPALSQVAPPAPAPGSAPAAGLTGRAIAAVAYRIASRHPAYVFGAENNLYQPDLVTRTDCSELVQVSVSYLLKHPWIDGSSYQYRACQHITVAQAARTPGALLFMSGSSGVHHVAVSLGDGRTAEARNSRLGVGIWPVGTRFNLAGLVPGFRYGVQGPTPFGPVEELPLEELLLETDPAQGSLPPDIESETTLPGEIDGIPIDHLGNINAPPDDPQADPDVPPFDIDKELEGL
jgi:cell wall-associated NlpC family hydrolase